MGELIGEVIGAVIGAVLRGVFFLLQYVVFDLFFEFLSWFFRVVVMGWINLWRLPFEKLLPQSRVRVGVLACLCALAFNPVTIPIGIYYGVV
ncbi:hypothetical protein O4H49_03440 [Kiloniella laminariae]|uniref:Uncharacterized protein n=1 Tax=Kiloniella laminariae TaxID=454162 RepID=A0ABT4LFD6_9PROT|nr:hypothetical protein [Kiloniella laminariae]MCZ4279816.1 hypothetical protein [Kiloniella laminariae]